MYNISQCSIINDGHGIGFALHQYGQLKQVPCPQVVLSLGTYPAITLAEELGTDNPRSYKVTVFDASECVFADNTTFSANLSKHSV